MRKYRRWSKEEKQRILIMKDDNHMTVPEIANYFAVSPTTITSLLTHIRSRGISKMQIATCPSCGKTGQRPGAHFCWYCGKDIRTEAMKLIERLQPVIDLCTEVRSEKSNEAVETLIETIHYLHNRG